jgi:hypothetical protein
MKLKLHTNCVTIRFIACCLFPFLLTSCKEEAVEFDANSCKGNSPFIKTMGFDSRNSFFTTSDMKVMGLQLQQSDQPGNPQARIVKTYQHPSWKKGGYLAPILIDQSGNIYTSPAPFINILNNPIANNNTIYRVDAQSGEMQEFMRLPAADSINEQNPFGIIGMIYLCETGTLYVSSVAGSRLHKEDGHIYAIDLKSKSIIDQLDHTDALGLGISYAAGKRQLFFGSARNADVNVITLNAAGKFAGKPQLAFSLQNLGAGGDDKVRRIKADNSGNLQVYCMEFGFNLIAAREKKETLYTFIYDESEKNWIQQLAR